MSATPASALSSPPAASIAQQGPVPRQDQPWSVHLLCRDDLSRDTRVRVTGALTLTRNGEPPTSVLFTREKLCLGDDGEEAGSTAFEVQDAEGSTPPHKIFLGVVLGALLAMVLLGAGVAGFHLWKRKKRAKLEGGRARESAYAPVDQDQEFTFHRGKTVYFIIMAV